MSRKKIIIISSMAVILVAVLFVVLHLFGKKRPVSTNPEFTKYISAYTSGVVSKNSTIKIQLVQDYAVQVKAANPKLDGIFEFSPSMKGKVGWLNETTLEFTPEKPMKSGTNFVGEFKLGKLLTIDNKDMQSFVFDFQTIMQNYEMQVEEIKTTDKEKFTTEKILCNFLTADVENIENLKKVVTAKQNGRTLEINWLPVTEEKKYLFEIDKVERAKDSSIVTIESDGSSINVDKKQELKLTVPSIDNFKLLFTRTISEPDQMIILQFSDPLNEHPEEGIITVPKHVGYTINVTDNIIKIAFPKRVEGNFQVLVSEGLMNINNKKLGKNLTLEFGNSSENGSLGSLKPAVRWVSKGVILPSSDNGLQLPFEAVNLKAVEVKILKIYENNILQFLQVNEINGERELYRVGKNILTKTIYLDKTNVVDFTKWNRFSLDLNELIKAEPGAIYRVILGFKKAHSLYKCADENTKDMKSMDETIKEENQQVENNFGDDENYYEGYNESYDWNKRDDPCSDSYTGYRQNIAQNIFASNIGLIAKRGNDGLVKVYAADLRTTEPMKDVKITLYSFQNQPISTIQTNGDGMAEFSKVEDPYLVVAKSGKESGYLIIQDGRDLSMSRFDVAGVAVTKGLKGFIYGERGVWRPGDSIYLTFVLKEEALPLPIGHPIILELSNPQNQVIKKLVQPKNATNFYAFRFKTDAEAVTGNYNATVHVGGTSYSKHLKIETVKPNRLKIDFTCADKILMNSKSSKGKMNVKWLTGTTAHNLKVQVDVVLNPVTTEFPNFKSFIFEDPSKKFSAESVNIFDQNLDNDGNAEIPLKLNAGENAPGQLRATFNTKVYEDGGNFSVDQFSLPYAPYESFVGLKTPAGDRDGMLLTDTTHLFDVITVTPEGNLLKVNRQLQVDVYKLEWRWWWDQGEEYFPNFSNNSWYKPYHKYTVNTIDGQGKALVRINYADWGRFYIRVYDPVSKHTCGKVIYFDYPGWWSRMAKDNPQGAAMLTFSSDKPKYKVGDKIKITIPTPDKGRALITVENGTKILQSEWIKTIKGETTHEIKVTDAMSPNIYISVTLIQPHAQTMNDLPIRMYGVIPVTVENPETHLEPVLKLPDEIKSETTVRISVSEKNTKEMTYTIAIVDDGLLDLTHFKTPDPWTNFYAKEALGVKTWDLYDFVIGAFSGELQRLLSIGGDTELNRKGGKKANRFEPMVRFLGPFTLYKGRTNYHDVKFPRYIGSVRTMLIAGGKNAFGFAEKTSKVTKPLMVLGTLPRVLGPGETVKLPVNIFVMDKNLKNVNLEVKTNELIKVEGQNKKSVTIKTTGDEFVDFDLKVGDNIGIGKITILATSGSESAQFDIEIDVRNPNPRVTQITEQTILGGTNWKTEIIPVGVVGTNQATIELSSIPPINLESRVKFLIAYPYGCVEQTTSSVFPQLYLADITELDGNKKSWIENNIKAAIDRLVHFQTESGAFNYWPGGNNISDWGTSYAGHFLLEAEKKGYSISSTMMKNWKKYQSETARNWKNPNYYYHEQLEQAYRLYTLALAGSPEIGAMNRMREMAKLDTDAAWRLAAAYFLAGKKDIAEKMVQSLSIEVIKYYEMSYSYGSDVRDKAMILETLNLLEIRKEDAFKLLKDISASLSSEQWFSTQTTAFSLMAVSKFIKKNGVTDLMTFSYQINSDKVVDKSTKICVSQIPVTIKTNAKQNVDIKNTGKGVLYARIISQGIPVVGDATDVENNLKMKVVYKNTKGDEINPEKITQGTNFTVDVSITNPGTKGSYQNLVLNQIFPSGWEIGNARLLDATTVGQTSPATYQDFRDDRVYTYFDINQGETKTFRVMLTATYTGRFYLPSFYSEAMYDNSINARKHGTWIEVVK